MTEKYWRQCKVKMEQKDSLTNMELNFKKIYIYSFFGGAKSLYIYIYIYIYTFIGDYKFISIIFWVYWMQPDSGCIHYIH